MKQKVILNLLKKYKNGTSPNKIFKLALHEKTAKHIRQLTKSEFIKANIRAMYAFINSYNAGRRLEQETLGDMPV